MRTSIGIDIGGTKILIGIVTESGEILRAKRYPMQRQTQQEAETAVFTAAGDFMSALTQEERAALCGIGSARRDIFRMIRAHGCNAITFRFLSQFRFPNAFLHYMVFP